MKSNNELSYEEREKIIDQRYLTASRIIIAVCVAVFSVWFVTQKAVPYVRFKTGMRTVKTGAVQYIKDKYGIDCEINEDLLGGFEWDKEKNMVCSCSFSMKTDSGNIEVYESNESGNYTYYDNYQYKEINEAVKKQLNSFLPGIQKVYAMLYTDNKYGEFGLLGKDMFYDGSNLDYLLSRCDTRIEASFVDTEFDNRELKSWLESIDADAELLSFDTQAHYDDYINTINDWGRYDRLNDIIRTQTARRRLEIMPYLPYINDTLLLGSYENNSYELESYGDILYCFDDPSRNDKITPTEISLQTLASDLELEYGKIYGDPISKAYRFMGSDCKVIVYYPIEKLNSYNEETAHVLIKCTDIMSYYKAIFRTDDYAVFSLRDNDPEFMLVNHTNITQ